MFARTTIVALCCLTATLSVAEAQRLTYEDLRRTALTHNPEIKAARARWNAAKAKVPQAAAWEDLQIGLDVERSGTTRFNSYSDVEYMASQKIPISGKNRSEARIAEAEALAVFQKLRRAELDTIAKVRAAWLSLANSRIQRTLNASQEQLLAETIEVARIQFEAAKREQTEVLAAETELERIRERAVEFEQTETSATADMIRMLGSSARFEIVTTDVSSERLSVPTEDRLDLLARQYRPEILSAQAGIRAAEARVELAHRNWIPDPEVRVEARRFPDRRGITEYDTGVFFNVPWLNGRKYKAAEEEAASGLQAARAEQEAAHVETRGMIRAQLAKLRAIEHHTAISREKILPLARQSLEVNRLSFQAGRNSVSDVLNSARTVRDAEAELALRRSEYLTSLAELEALVGAPLRTSLTSKSSDRSK